MQKSRTNLVTELPTLEGLLLWTMRAWVIGHCHGRDATRGIQKVFDHLGVPEAVEALDGFMNALGAGARRTLEVHCVCYPDVSEDERDLLRILALQQYEAPDDAYVVLAGMLTEHAAAAACTGAHRLACTLNAAGHTLRSAPSMEQRAGMATHPFRSSQTARYLH